MALKTKTGLSSEKAKEFAKVFEQLIYRHSAWKVWQDFVDLCAISISNAVDKRETVWETREKEYMSIKGSYTDDEFSVFVSLFSITIYALEDNPAQDFLGELYMKLNFGNGWKGQFFTPFHISEMMARMTIGENTQDEIKKKGYIRSNMYRSVPRGEYDHIVYRLLDKSINMIGVPGFYVSDEGEIKISLHQCMGGFFVPVFDEKKQIQGMQIRLDDPFESKRKYIWLSSSEKNGGCSSGSPVQISGDIFNSEVIYVTEGALKGQIAHHLSGKPFIAAAGVNQQKELDSLLLRICNEGKCSTIVDAFDMDDDKNEHVLRGHRNLAWLAAKYGFSPKRVTWDRKYKGIDDYLLAVRNLKGGAL